MAQTIELARALLRRKELQEKVDLLRHIKDDQLHETVMQRRQINETVDDIAAKVPKVSINEVTKAFDWHARQLREVDAAIQKANWDTLIQVPDDVLKDFESIVKG